MRVLITGAKGQVGRELAVGAWPVGTEVIALARQELDLAHVAAVAGVIQHHRPNVIINAAAYTAVDKAETEREAAFAVNAHGVEALARAAADIGAPLLHISTDYVFDGQADRAYTENDSIAPLGVYGASKAAGEDAVRRQQPQHVILRTSWVYAAHGTNFVKTMLRLGRERELVRVVADQTGTPTAARDIADALVAIAQHVTKATPATALWGTYHYTARGATTWHGLAAHIFERESARTGKQPKLEAIGTAEYPTPARRPANSRLACGRFDQAFSHPRNDWRIGVDRVLTDLAAAPGADR